MDNTNYSTQNYQSQQTLDTYVSKVMRLVYVKMFLALVVTALVAWFVANSGLKYTLYGHGSAPMIILAIAEIGLVIWITAGINKLSSPMATVLFFLFAIINGLTLSVVFLAYAPEAIAKTFFITAATFGAMSVYGYTTSQDLTKLGSILFMALIGLIICSIVNLFLHSDSLGWIISIAGVLIFVGLTAWDTQKIKMMASQVSGDNVGRLATIGALSLYLDFINLFLYLLRIFGNRN